jgi:hypothetical protein
LENGCLPLIQMSVAFGNSVVFDPEFCWFKFHVISKDAGTPSAFNFVLILATLFLQRVA